MTPDEYRRRVRAFLEDMAALGVDDEDAQAIVRKAAGDEAEAERRGITFKESTMHRFKVQDAPPRDQVQSLAETLIARDPESVRAMLQQATAEAERKAGAADLARLELEAARKLLGDEQVTRMLRQALTAPRAAQAPAAATKSARSPVDAIADALAAQGFTGAGVGGYNPFAQPTKKGR